MSNTPITGAPELIADVPATPPDVSSIDVTVDNTTYTADQT